MGRRKEKTGPEKVFDAMEFSRRGPMAYLFIMEAIGRYARAVSKSDPKDYEGSFVNGDAWIDTANELIEKLNLNLEN